jgi:NAD+ kinase
MISADGVIVATPVGSTSYSLSAGGSILSPDTDVLSITPISPQNLFIHPIIVPADSKLSFILKNDAKGAHINIDGEDIGRVVQNEKIVIELSKHSIKFVRLAEQNFYSTLRQKLFLQNTNIRMK